MSNNASDARERLRQLQSSFDHAFAADGGASAGADPRFDAVRREVADLRAMIAEQDLDADR